MPDTGVSEMSDVAAILRIWEDQQANNPNFDPEITLTRLAEIIEADTESYLKMDPDPFDERHPSRVDTECGLGHNLKTMFRKDTFMNKLVNDYLHDNFWARRGNSTKDSRQLNIVACRLMLDILPGLEVSAVFQMPEMESLMLRLFSWAEKSMQPLQSYATGLLAAAMEVQEIAANFREQNAKLVPLKLQELHKLQKQSAESRHQGLSVSITRPFAHLGQSPEEVKKNDQKKSRVRPRKESSDSDDKRPACDSAVSGPKKSSNLDNGVMSPPLPTTMTAYVTRPSPGHGGECSNSSWAEMESFVIGSIQMYPSTLATKQMLILRYLTPMGEYQELLSHVFEQNALELILNYVNVRETKDSRLAFEALKYLAALLCHKKFSIEFINMKGLQILLKVPQPSIAATGVSICLYYLAYCEDAMERVTQLPHQIIVELVKYSLWLLECSHDSGRCHATMFFGLSFQFRVILAEFDKQDGLRKLYNIISTLPILSLESEPALNEDEICSARQIVRHVCVALKRYLEAHLCIKAEALRRMQFRERGGHFEHTMLTSKTKSSQEDVMEQTQVVLDLMPFRAHWEPVDQMLNLGGVLLLLQIIAFTYEWNYNGRAETVRSALDALAVCSLVPQVQVMLCENVPVDLHLREERITFGINILLGAAEGEIAADSDVQRAALIVLINCVCAPINRVGGLSARFPPNTSNKDKGPRTSQELITKVWESVQSSNGIFVLLQLMMVKTPITDADSIRALACQALAGLARSETVRQIISKLPLFSNGQFQVLMRDPVLQDKRHEHATFQRHALELMERVLGKSKPRGQELETSLANMHRANVVAQTRILYNDRQLFQLIHQHLLSRGLSDSATALHREASLPGAPIKLGTGANFPPLSYARPRINSFNSPSRSNTSSPLTSRSLVTAPMSRSSLPSPGTPMGPPLRISLQRRSDRMPMSSTSRSLQKQISAEHTIVASSPMQKNAVNFESHVTLDSIVTEYLTNQHALCKNPVVPCPQFNLFEPHKCPNPKVKNLSPLNVATRLTRRSLGGPRVTHRLDRRLVHSRFCPVRTFRLSDDEGYYTCCTFLSCDKYLLLGTYQGEVKKFNLQTGAEEAIFQCHESYIYHLEASRTSNLLLTSATWRMPQCAVWSIDKNFEQKFALDTEGYIEFSKVSQDRIIGTQAEDATIYDVATGQKIVTLKPQISNQYTKNRATFSPLDELVLSDGVLWDVNSGKEIHKLDKLNQTTSGVFHPCGLEVVSNTEVWDLRTFHLLRTVPALDQCEVQFSPGPSGSAIYSISLEQEMEEETAFDSSFKTFDAHDYSNIATIDVKKNIYGLAINTRDTQVALVENQGVFDSVQESSVRVYDVGRRRADDDEGEEEEDEEEIDGSDDGSASGTDDDPLDNAPDTDAPEDNNEDSNGAQSNNEDEDDDEFMITLSGSGSDNSLLSSSSDSDFEAMFD